MKQRHFFTQCIAVLLAFAMLYGCGGAPASAGGPSSGTQNDSAASREELAALLERQIFLYEKGNGGVPFERGTAEEPGWGFAGVFAEEEGIPYGQEGGRQELIALMYCEWLGASLGDGHYFSDVGAYERSIGLEIAELELHDDTARAVVIRRQDGWELLDAEYCFSRVDAGEDVLSSPAAALTLDGSLWRYDSVRTVSRDLEYEPVTISTEEELRALCERVNRHEEDAVNGSFVLANDIALDPAEPWTPMGHFLSPDEDWLDFYTLVKVPGGFNGTFDGAGHTISGVNVHWEEFESEVGFFGRLGPDARVFDLTVEGSVADGGYAETMNGCIGGFVGRVPTGADVTNCHFIGTVDGYCYAGGFVGFAGGYDTPLPKITDCSADVDMTVCCNSGGFAGMIYGGVSDCDAAGRLTIESKGGVLPIVIGGFAGTLTGQSLTGCRSGVRVEYAVDGANRMGNFIGETSFLCEITDCVIDPAVLHDGWYLIGMKCYKDSVVDIRKEAWQTPAE